MWNKMIEIMKQDIKPATGCTEPIPCFAAATAAKELGEPVQAVKAFVSANLMKNGMGVMVPGTACRDWLLLLLLVPWAAMLTQVSRS